MSIERKQSYMGKNETILQFAGELFQNMSVKVNKNDVPEVDGRRILKAATILSKDGKIVDGTKVTNDKSLGLVYRDIDFTYSNGTENVPVTIFGFIKESTLSKAVAEEAKAAMKMIMFV